jgi:hypothetical protein
MDKAIFGMIGVALGVILTMLKEWWLQSRKSKKEAEYLAIQITSLLDRYIVSCAAVVGDDGLSHGQPDKDGYYRVQISEPTFEPSLLKVEWKCLPVDLMYEILTFPNEIEVANQHVSAAFEYSASPPEYAEGFEERPLQYATLGIAAENLASKLRGYAGLPVRISSKWDHVKYMKESKRNIEERRGQLASQHAFMISQLTAKL